MAKRLAQLTSQIFSQKQKILAPQHLSEIAQSAFSETHDTKTGDKKDSSCHSVDKKDSKTCTVCHPLDPLTDKEILAAAAIVKDSVKTIPIRFEHIRLNEPDTHTLASWKPGSSLPREAYVSYYNSKTNDVYEAIVEIRTKRILKQHKVPGKVACAILPEDFAKGTEAALADPRVIEALKKRGVTDLTHVQLDPWSSGYYGPADEIFEVNTNRVIHCFLWVKDSKLDNAYAHPIEGLNVIVDVNEYKVLRVIDRGAVPIPKGDIADQYTEDLVKDTFRKDLKPLHVVQPEGPSFSVDGHKIHWQKWNVRVGFNGREGLTLHDISYQDGDKLRSIVSRASIGEMVVPYGEPRGGHYRKNAFDMGEYGLGYTASSLTLGCDCLGVIHYFDGFVNDSHGNPVTIPRVICVHEEDTGILWRHLDILTSVVDTRRNRRLVISFVATVGNYDYAFYWYFYLDGSIQLEVKATGIMNTASISHGTVPDTKHGTLVAPGILAQNHQHLFIARLHMAVDGNKNTVSQVETISPPTSASNPHGNEFYVQETILKTEKEAQSVVDPRKHRYWKISNPNVFNRMGGSVAFRLIPHGAVFPVVQPESWVSRRAPWMHNHLYVTPYRHDEKFPSGQFVYQSRGTDGIHVWTEKNRDIENTDLVVWHVFGLHHTPRLEDWPITLVNGATSGFLLQPCGFFAFNPSIDVPPSKDVKSKLAPSCCASETPASVTSKL